MRGKTLEAFADQELLEVIDMTSFVAEQRPLALSSDGKLRTPFEAVYTPVSS